MSRLEMDFWRNPRLYRELKILFEAGFSQALATYFFETSTRNFTAIFRLDVFHLNAWWTIAIMG